MPVNYPVLMPVWMLLIAIVVLLVVAAWLLRAWLVTRRDLAREVGDVPMAPGVRQAWAQRVEEAAGRFERGETDLRGLHLELSSVIRGFAAERSGEPLHSATVREILDMADTTGPRPIEERLALVLRRGRPLDTNPLGHVGELLAVWEEPSFSRDPHATAEVAVDEAREVVTRW